MSGSVVKAWAEAGVCLQEGRLCWATPGATSKQRVVGITLGDLEQKLLNPAPSFASLPGESSKSHRNSLLRN
jgi:hypothetical protein